MRDLWELYLKRNDFFSSKIFSNAFQNNFSVLHNDSRNERIFSELLIKVYVKRNLFIYFTYWQETYYIKGIKSNNFNTRYTEN